MDTWLKQVGWKSSPCRNHTWHTVVQVQRDHHFSIHHVATGEHCIDHPSSFHIADAILLSVRFLPYYSHMVWRPQVCRTIIIPYIKTLYSILNINGVYRGMCLNQVFLKGIGTQKKERCIPSSLEFSLQLCPLHLFQQCIHRFIRVSPIF